MVQAESHERKSPSCHGLRLAIDSILDSMLIWAKDTTSKDRSMDIQNRATSASASYEDSALAYILLWSYELLNHCEYMTLERTSFFCGARRRLYRLSIATFRMSLESL
jgi:hypothetical protein